MKILKLATYLMVTIPVITQLYLLLSPLQKSSYGILMAGLVLLLISVCLLVILSRFVWRAHSDSA